MPNIVKPSRRRSRIIKGRWRKATHSHHDELVKLSRRIALRHEKAREALQTGLPDTAAEHIVKAVKIKVERDQVRKKNTASMSLRKYARKHWGIGVNAGRKWGIEL